jgi:hypothetical protein
MRVLIVSDIHYASPAEQQRPDYEAASFERRWQRGLLRFYRHYIWLRDPFAHNGLLEQFLELAGPADLVIANGDYSCDSAFVGVSDDAAAESARLCLSQLRARFAERLAANLGDHEIGKVGLCGNRGGLRLASYHRAVRELGLMPFWRRDYGPFVLLGMTSTVLALPLYRPEIQAEEWPLWQAVREEHLRALRECLNDLDPDRRLLLFLHDPSALPYLAEEPTMRARLNQVVATVIGHLHSPLVLWKSRMLAGLPPIRFLGTTIRRTSEALHRARSWRPFRLRLCPSLAGVELLKDGGFLELNLEAKTGSVRWTRHRIPR